MGADYTFTLDGQTFNRMSRGPIEEFATQRWQESKVLGDANPGTVLTFIGTESQRWPFRGVRCTTAQKDKLKTVYSGRVPVLFKTPQNGTGFNVVLTGLVVRHQTPLSNSLFECDFDLTAR